MSFLKNKQQKKDSTFILKKNRVNAKVKAANPEYRMILNKSLLYTSAQVVDRDGKVIALFTDKWTDGKTKVERANNAGKAFAKDLLAKKVSTVAVDRNGNLYHGRIKSFVEWVREWGITC